MGDRLCGCTLGPMSGGGGGGKEQKEQLWVRASQGTSPKGQPHLTVLSARAGHERHPGVCGQLGPQFLH